MSLNSIFRKSATSIANVERRLDPPAASGIAVPTHKVVSSLGQNPWGLALNNMSQMSLLKALESDAVKSGITVATHDADYVNPKTSGSITGSNEGKIVSCVPGITHVECIYTGKSAPIAIATYTPASREASVSGVATDADKAANTPRAKMDPNGTTKVSEQTPPENQNDSNNIDPKFFRNSFNQAKNRAMFSNTGGFSESALDEYFKTKVGPIGNRISTGVTTLDTASIVKKIQNAN